MDLVSIIVVLIVLGLVLWLITAYLPIPQPIKNIILCLIVLVACLWLLSGVGVLHLR